MAKKEKVKKMKVAPKGMKCYQKVGGGSHRFTNRIIKPGQKFWIDPDNIAEIFKDVFKEVAADLKAVIVTMEVKVTNKKNIEEKVPTKFIMEKAIDEAGEIIKKGNSALYNIIGEDGSPLNEKPLRKGKAEELLAEVSV